jgi:DNA polymerase I-like protein with 3'-5' exonuclease and polymerase domains
VIESNSLVSLDIETACNVTGCRDFGSSKCREDHSLSPWHGRITKLGVFGDGIATTFENCADTAGWLDSRITDCRLVGHNFKFDLLWLQVHGVDVSQVDWHCTQLMAYVLTEKIPDSWLSAYESARGARAAAGETWHRKAGKHSLKTLAPYFLGVEAFWEKETHEDDAYVLKDAEYTLLLAKVLEEKLKQRGEWDFYLRLLSWTKMLLAAELRGIRIDLVELARKESELVAKEADLRKRLDEVWARAHKTYHELQVEDCWLKYDAMATRQDFDGVQSSPKHMKLLQAALPKLQTAVDYDSPKQMSWLLRDYLGYDITSLEGDETTGREVLERLANEGKEDVRTFLEWRKIQKLLTAFIPTYRELATDSVIHPVFNPTNTRTGRTSSERPNLQQVPPELRGLFKARPGYKFIAYDAAAIEAKLIALYSQDPALNSVVTSGRSLHDVNTQIFFGLEDGADIKRDYPAHRAATKNVGFALFYGAGANRLRITFANKGFHFTQSQCEEILRRFKANYKTAIDYHKDLTRFFESGEKMTNLLGRPVMIEDPSEAYMKGFNSVIQGSASDLNLEGAHRAWQALQAEGIDAHPLLFVHDAVLFEVREDQVEEADQVIVDKLTNFNLPIKLTVEGGISDNWSK